MTISINTSGTETTDGTEEILATVDDAGVFIFSIDTSNMALGDEIEVRVYKRVSFNLGRLLFLKRTFKNVQGDGTADAGGDGEVIKDSIPIPSPESMRITLKRTLGTDRAYDWAIYEL